MKNKPETSNNPRHTGTPKLKFKGRPQSIYVPKKTQIKTPGLQPSAKATDLPSTDPSSAHKDLVIPREDVLLLPPSEHQANSEQENRNLQNQLKVSQSEYAELLNKYDLTDEDFKNAVFTKSKVEREHKNIDRELNSKIKVIERLSEENASNSEQVKLLGEKINSCEKTNSRLQTDNNKILQSILEMDKEIKKISAARPQKERMDKGVNTVSHDDPVTRHAKGKEQAAAKRQLDEKNKELESAYNLSFAQINRNVNYRLQIENKKSMLENKEEMIVQAKKKEEKLTASKARLEEELAELKRFLQSFNKYEDRSGLINVRFHSAE